MKAAGFPENVALPGIGDLLLLLLLFPPCLMKKGYTRDLSMHAEQKVKFKLNQGANED